MREGKRIEEGREGAKGEREGRRGGKRRREEREGGRERGEGWGGREGGVILYRSVKHTNILVIK